MTDTTTEETTPATEADDTPQPEQATPDPEQATDEQAGGPGAEAARYRRRLRDAEASRDAHAAHADAARRALVDTLAATHRVKPQALWASGVDVDDLLDDDGNVDSEKVREACETAATELGLSRTPRPDPTQGPRGVEFSHAGAWVDAFRPGQ